MQHKWTRFFSIRNLILCITLSICFSKIFCQSINFGIPDIYNYDRTKYKGGTQTWEICTGKFDEILAANNEGLLRFDGHKWEKYSLPNKTILRSICYDSITGRIYAGGQDELGYFQPDNLGVLKYHDLKPTIPKAFNNLEDVWNIKMLNGSIYFRSLNKIFSFNGSQWKVFSTKETTFLAQVDDFIIYNDWDKGLFKIINGNTIFIEGSEIFKYKTITGIISLRNEWYIMTEKDGVVKYFEKKWLPIKGSTNDYLKNNRIHSVCKINDTLMAVGTYLNGIILIDDKMRIQFALTKIKGLQNNTIGSLFFTKNHQLWAGTYNGIDAIDLGSPFSTIYPDGSLQGTVYATVIYNQKIYCGTENGLYVRPLPQNLGGNDIDFRLVKGSEGQVWGLDIVQGDLIMSHNDGAFVVTDNIAKKISSYSGSWKFIEFDNGNYCIGGAYTGLFAFRKSGKNWQEIGKISGFDESCRIMVKDQKYLWVSHPYRGLFRLDINMEKLSANIENYGQENGLPGHLRNMVYGLENQILVSTEDGFFKFDPTKNNFHKVLLPGINESNKNYYKALTQQKDLLWLATDESFGYIKYDNKLFNSKKYDFKFMELKKGLVPGFEKIFPLDNNDALLLTTKGLIFYNNSRRRTRNIQVYISKLYDINQQLVLLEGFNRNQENSDILALKNSSNALILDFGSSACSEDIKYRYKLNQAQDDWSAWDTKSQKELNNLTPGKYTLELQAGDAFGNISPTLTFSFNIMPPWYKTKTALFLYFLTGLLLLFYSRQRLVKKYELITTDLEEQRNESEALVLQLQKEKLEAELLFKTKELGLSTMHLVQKNEEINKLKIELNRIVKKVNDPEVKSEIESMVSIFSDDERLDDNWESFAQNFDQVHNDFLSRLKAQYPQLSPRDLKLCAYLKLNLTTKDIAPLLNISVRGIEISRYRLRKKMDLPNNISLNDYMMGF